MTEYNESQNKIIKYAYAKLQIENKNLQQQINTNEKTIYECKKIIKSLNAKWKQKIDTITQMQNEYISNKNVAELMEYMTSLNIDINTENMLDVIKNYINNANKNILYKKFILTIINLLNNKKFVSSMLYNFNIIINAIDTQIINDYDIHVLIDNLLAVKETNVIIFDIANNELPKDDTVVIDNKPSLYFENPDNLPPEYKIYFECYGYPTTEIEFNNIDKEQLELIKNELNNKTL
jgi:hypothetical protein